MMTDANAHTARRPRRGGLLAGAAATAVLLGTLLPATAALALPPSGAGGDTPGTSSSVSPGTLQPCQTISFSVAGFPAGETLYVKIDDGVGYGDTSVQGSGVVHMQAISGSGAVNGSFPLPCDIAPGAHWLRYLASSYADPSNPDSGTIGYTNRGGSDFTVVAASGGSGGSGGTGGSAGSGLGGAVPAAGTTTGTGAQQVGGQGGTLTIDPNAVQQPTPTPTPKPTATASPSATPAAEAAPDATGAAPAAAGVPWAGIGVGGGVLAIGVVAAALLLRRRGPSPS